jgi:hypothetical protein
MREYRFSWPSAAIIFAVGGLYLWIGPVGVVAWFIFLLPILCAIELGYSRDRTGWMWGLFLNWLGVIILACMRPVAVRA